MRKRKRKMKRRRKRKRERKSKSKVPQRNGLSSSLALTLLLSRGKPHTATDHNRKKSNAKEPRRQTDPRVAPYVIYVATYVIYVTRQQQSKKIRRQTDPRVASYVIYVTTYVSRHIHYTSTTK